MSLPDRVLGEPESLLTRLRWWWLEANPVQRWRERRAWAKALETHVWAWCPDCDVWTGVPARHPFPAQNPAAIYHATICPNAADRLRRERQGR